MKPEGLKILVIDDNKINLDSAMAELGNDNLVKVIDKFYKALEVLEGPEKFDMVLIDLLMVNDTYTSLEMVGLSLAIVAAKNGSKFVGVLSDDFSKYRWRSSYSLFPIKSGVSICGARLRTEHSANKCFKAGNFAEEVSYAEAYDLNAPGHPDLKPGYVEAKSWVGLASALLEEGK